MLETPRKVERVEPPLARPPHVELPTPAPLALERLRSASESAAWLTPLVGINVLFDEMVVRLGPPGRRLRRPRGRSLLGWTGLLLLATGVALVVLDRTGWTW